MKLITLAILLSLASPAFATAPLSPCGEASVKAAKALFKINNPEAKKFKVKEKFVKSTPIPEGGAEQVYDIIATAAGVTYSAYRMTCIESGTSATVIGFEIPYAN